MDDVTILIMAGGAARRFPGKLAARLDGVPMLLRVYRTASAVAPVVIAANGNLSPELEAECTCPILLDESPEFGPLAAVLGACAQIVSERVLVLAGDMPTILPADLQALRDAMQTGDEAVVAQTGAQLEPLLALYDRRTLLRIGIPRMQAGERSLRRLLNDLQVRTVSIDAKRTLSINHHEDALAAFHEVVLRG